MRRAPPASVSPCLELYSTTICTSTGNKSISLPIGIKGISAGTPALIDSGAGGNFVDQNFARQHGLTQKALATPVKVYNVDVTPTNEAQ